ncbi:MAG: hypothetical protein CMF96_10320 [Candidatus Marinimicrobia bacterium]|nr:hypothetical protein [Candidatus Neomarinimicrobiota bacterium]|tara:strand:- start:16670 stop:17164 length:495 start_codon:yes stop_codon:yes gene_type:complete
MLKNKQNLAKNIVLTFGFIFFIYTLYLDRFESSLIIAFSILICWMAISLIWDNNRDYKQIGNTLIGAGLIISFLIFLNFGLEQTAIPIGGFIFNSDGIFKAVSLLFLFIISGFLFRYLNELVPDNPKLSEEKIQQEKSKPFESDDWEFLSEDEVLSGDYEVIKD